MVLDEDVSNNILFSDLLPVAIKSAALNLLFDYIFYFLIALCVLHVFDRFTVETM